MTAMEDLVERTRELSELSGMLAECARGGGVAAVISGGLGCGKSELVQALKSQALDVGFLVLGAVSSWAEQESPGGVLCQLLQSVEGGDGPCYGVARLLAQMKRTCEGAGGQPAPAALKTATTALMHQLCAEVLQSAKRFPVLLCVDDVQCADALSLHWIRHLLRNLRAAPIAVVVTECQLPGSVDPELHAELLRLPNYRRLVLGRLSKEGVHTLVAQQLGEDAADLLAASVYRTSSGNPLLVRALLADYRYCGPPAGTASCLPVGDAYADAILGCLRRGGAILQRVARVLAVLNDGDDAADLLARLLDEEQTGSAERALHALEVAGLTEGRLLRHPAAGAAILAQMSHGERSALHRHAAELLYEDGAPVTRISRHLVAAERDLQRWAVPVLCEAAERHLYRNAVKDAYTCLNAAVRLCVDDTARIPLKTLTADVGWLLNPAMSVRYLSELVIELREGQLPDRAAMVLAKCLPWHGRFDDAAVALERLTDGAHVGDRQNPEEIRATRELLSSSYPTLVASGVRKRPPDQPGAAAARPDEVDMRIRAAEALAYVLRYGPDDKAAADAEAGLRAMRLDKKTHEWIICAVAALELADELVSAGSWCDYWLEQASAWEAPLWEAEFASMRASIALRQGDLVRARRLAERALAQVPAESWGICPNSPLSWLIQAATEAGDYDAAAAYLRVPVPDSMFRSRFGPHYLHARGQYHLETGQPYAAVQDLTACGDLLKAWRFDQPTLIPWRAGVARAYLLLGDTQRAHRLAREQVVLAGRRPSRARGISLRILAATSNSAQRVSLLTESVQILQGCGDRLQLAGALADLGRAHSQAGRKARSRTVMDMAARLAEDCGAEPLLRSLRREQEASAVCRSELSASHTEGALVLLSRAERRVASLAACGHTNRQISETLSITISTVEQHLTSAFRKLGIKGRKELPEEVMLEVAVQ